MKNKNAHGPKVAVIGSGISGIAAAAMLQKNGFQVEIFEKSTKIGGVWALAYPNVRLQNIAEQYHISDFPWPFSPDLHPTGAQILKYLEAAVNHFNLHVHLQHRVIKMETSADGWHVDIQTPEGKDHLHFDFVMISSGHYSDGKKTAKFPGQETFKGRIMTERDLAQLEEFQNKRIVVTGFGKSAVDMTEFAALQPGTQVSHVFRTPRWMLPRSFFGLHFTRMLFNRFGTVMMPCWSHPSAAERFLHERTPAFVNTFWAQIEGIIRKKILKRGQKAGPAARQRLSTVIPEHPLLLDLRSASCLEPEKYYDLVASGQIQPHHAEISAFHPDGLWLSNGTKIDCDVVVMSFGSHTPQFPFLPDTFRKMLESEPDGVQLYRHLIHPEIPRLGFAGFNHGFMHVPAVEVGTLWISALWEGELSLSNPQAMHNSMSFVQQWKREHIHFEPSRSCGVNTRFQQYIDILLKDLRISPYRKLPNLPAEIFARYRAADYARVFEDYQDQKREGKNRAPSPDMH